MFREPLTRLIDRLRLKRVDVAGMAATFGEDLIEDTKEELATPTPAKIDPTAVAAEISPGIAEVLRQIDNRTISIEDFIGGAVSASTHAGRWLVERHRHRVTRYLRHSGSANR